LFLEDYMNNTGLRAACAAATLVAGWNTAAAIDIEVDLDSDRAYTSSAFLNTWDQGSFPGLNVDSTGAVGPTENYFVNSNDFVGGGDRYLFLGNFVRNVGEFAATYNVAVSLRSDVAAGFVGDEWETVFPGFNEDSIGAAIVNLTSADPGTAIAATGTLVNFFNAFDSEGYWPTIYTTSSILAFSAGEEAGYIYAEPVPEPATLAVLGLGALALRRRRK
jgi:hypothetical protein